MQDKNELQGDLGKFFAPMGVDKELGIGADGDVNVSIWIGSWFSRGGVKAFEAVSCQALVALTFLRLFVACGTKTTFGDVRASAWDTIAFH